MTLPYYLVFDRSMEIYDAKLKISDAKIECSDDGMLECPKCHKHKTTYYELQTRCADEPMTVFAQCHNDGCGKRWRG